MTHDHKLCDNPGCTVEDKDSRDDGNPWYGFEI